MCYAAVLPGMRSLATTTEAVGRLLGFRHTARRRLRRAGLWRSREGAGVAGAGCDGAESAADVVSAAPPSGTCGGGAWPWWAAHPREAMEERVPSSAR